VVARKNAKSKTTARKAVTKKAVAKKPTAKKAPAKKKPTAKKAVAKKTVAKKPAAKKAATKKAVAKKPAVVRKTSSPVPPPTWEPMSDGLRAFGRATPKTTAAPRGRVWLLDVPYQLRDTAKYNGARWDAEARRWVCYRDKLPDVLRGFAAQPHSWEKWQQDDANGGWEPAASKAQVTLREHQQVAATAIERAAKCGRPGFLLADDVGLGKTYSTIAGLDALGDNLRILVLCPLSVVAHWRRSIDSISDGSNRWCVINYDRVKNLLSTPTPTGPNQRKRTKNKAHATKGVSLVDWDVVVLDEAHKLRNPTSQRTSATRRVIAGGENTFSVWLSATAGQNPLELSYLSPMLEHATGFKSRDFNDFEEWCKQQGFSVKRGSFGQWSWDRNEVELERMRQLLFGGTPAYGLRRRPQDIAGWPDLQRIAFPQELPNDERALYEKAWEEFRAALELDPRGKNSPNALVAALRLRQKASLLRCEQTAELAADLIESGRQVAISIQFIESADRIQDALRRRHVSCARITGEVSASDREQERIRFQTGEAQAVVFTVTEGISLHASEQAVSASSTPRAMLLHDMRWSALDVAQIEGRCHRDGENAAAWYLFASDSVEEKVARAVLTKLEDMGGMLGDDVTGLNALWDAVGTV
jgi:hypothetical protein